MQQQNQLLLPLKEKKSLKDRKTLIIDSYIYLVDRSPSHNM